MKPYNAYAKKKINNLIEEACDNEIHIANECLKSATDILEKFFIGHSIDSNEDDINRIETKIRLYQDILGAYDEIISQLPSDIEEEILDFKEKLRRV